MTITMDRFDLGVHTRKIRTSSDAAQRWFNLGLNWCFGFNQEEGVKCFHKALEFDPDCVMAHWGIAYGSGPFYNLTWRDYGKAEADRFTRIAFDHLQIALRLSASRTEDAERHLVEALTRRFQEPHGVSPEQFDKWDDDYAAAVRRVHHAFPDDHDIMALLVEALITRTPRRLWDLKTGLPARNADTLEALALCERSMAMTDKTGERAHLAILHLHIHVMEMSSHPEQALRSADLLSTMAPDAGHLNHMPAHIYAQCGDYEKARIVSEHAVRADDMYADYAGSHNFYVTARGHDLHLMMHTCMFLGQYGPALAAANKIRAIMTEDILTMKDRPKLVTTTEAYYAMKMHVLVRFGRWREIIGEPPPGDPKIYRISTPMHHYARGIAYATLQDPEAADRERTLFRDAVARLPADLKFLSNLAQTTLAVAGAMLDGEVEYHRGNHDAAFAHLRDAVHRDDNLNYTEPWAWMHPPRHALAALLMEQDHHAEAESIYRDDLGLSGGIQRCAQHPDNVWALHGLVECLQRRSDTTELPALQAKLAAALAKVDVPITSSCMCRTRVYQADGCCS
ncbi:tetratricopeptide repeat protein [Reyranella sp. CPCC 100927]|uniref:tetratricopeptide repeat protein n=1 Tax=Reyranella sp. CPCC 100927 TaxID=2599616 RepID=UPI00351AA210